MKQDITALIALNRIFHLEPHMGYKLISALEAKGLSVEDFFLMEAKDRVELLPQGTGTKPKQFLFAGKESLERARKEYEELSSQGIHFITPEEFPEQLRNIHGTPLLLYMKSCSLPCFVFSHNITAIVGTRDPSPYGIHTTQLITAKLVDDPDCPNDCVVSGLALGIDYAAHMTALENGVNTIAVLLTGITDPIYPYRHTDLAERIAETPGSALVTSFPPGTAPTAPNFLARNHIIAGLAHKLILVESRTSGGGMVCARLAYDYRRDVYAVPGRIDDIRSAGCNQLIENGIAKIITEKICF